MKRIATSTKSVDKFGAGKHGFTNGNAVSGIPATDLEDSWFDNVQEEICGVVEAAGLALDGNNRAQLLAALRASGVFVTQPVADNSTKAATTGWVRTAMANIATAAGFSYSLLANGYIKFPSWLGGLIIQWGSTSVNMAASGTLYNTAVTWPIAFPTACLSANATLSNCPNAYLNASSESISVSGMTLVTAVGVAPAVSIFRWIAFGF